MKYQYKSRTMLLLLMVLLSSLSTYAQNNSMVGDGFGGRAGYCPANINLGQQSAFAVCGSNNQLYVWGVNQENGFGAATPANSATPIAVPGMTNVIQFAGGRYNAAIKSDGTGWLWGKASTILSLNLPTPTQVITDAYQCDATTNSFSAAFVKKDGTVWLYGYFTFLSPTNCLDATSSCTLLQVPGITNAKRVVMDKDFLLILLADGTVKYLGYFAGSSTSTVTTVPNLSNIVAIEGGNNEALFLNSAGQVYYAYRNDATPTLITFPSGAAPIKAVAMTGNSGYMALDDNGNYYAWGYESSGQIGGGLAYNNSTYRATPLLRGTNVRDIKGGFIHSFYIKNDGTLWATGSIGSWTAGVPNDLYLNKSSQRSTSYIQLDPVGSGLCAIPTACFTGMPPCVAGTTAPALTPTTATNSCPTATVDLTSLALSSTTPSGASLIWSTHKTPTSASDTLTTAQASAISTAGKYYALYYDATNACYSPADSVDITITTCTVNLANACPTATVNLMTAISASNMPSGATVTWHTGTPATTANQVTDPTAISTSGNYYMAYFDGTNNCYSETSQAVTVTITACGTSLSASNPAPQTATVGQSKSGNAATELAPTGGTMPYTYSDGSSDPACTAPSGATALPAGSNLTVNSSTGAYTYTAPNTAGTYYYCIKICDASTPTALCVIKTYTVTVTSTCAAGSVAPVPR